MPGWVGLAVVSVVMAALGQFAWKLGARALGTFSLVGMALSPYVWGGLALFGLASVLWIKVLTRAPLSVAYPFTALNYLIIPLLSWRIFNEPITVLKVAGMVAIVAGVIVIGFG